ncbi:helix-turn-helix domain-containing protein [Hydrogenophaga sp. RWCD_12]|uniref:helix-turn-helix transcriptional regulator n=1 Tax=Hydrogenophaga sp. RWCD_12 TaxID=3391190 RepID=UPI00398479F4
MPHLPQPAFQPAGPIELLLAQGLCPPASVHALTLTHLGWQTHADDLGTGLRLFWAERGNCHFRIEGQPFLALDAGCAVLLPRDARLRVEPASIKPMPWLMVVDIQTTFWLQSQLLMAGSRPVEVLRGAALPEALQMMRLVVQDQVFAEESPEQQRWLRPAALALVARMLAVLSGQPGASPLAAVATDRRLGKAVTDAMLHEGVLPGIDDLAMQCHCARATFTNRFHDLTGDSYLSYLTAWRMNLSVLRFQQQRATVAQEAARYGYGSEAGFRKAFARVVGTPPGSVRRAAAPGQAGTFRQVPAEPMPAPVIQISQHTAAPDLPALIASVIARL